MQRLRTYLELDDTPEVVATHAPEPLTEEAEAEALAAQLQRDPDQARAILRLLDGMEDFALPVVPDELVQGTDFPVISEEGFVDDLNKLWETLLAWLRKLKELWTHYADSSASALDAILYQAEHLKDATRKQLAGATMGREPLTLETHLPAMSVLYVPARNMGELINHLKRLEVVCQHYYKFIHQQVEGQLSGVIRFIGSLRPEHMSEDDVTRLTQLVERVSPVGLISRLSLTARNGAHHYEGPHLLGNVQLVMSAPQASPKTLQEHNRVQLRLKYSNSQAGNNRAVSFPRFTLSLSDQCLTQVERLAQLLEPAFSMDSQRRRKHLLDELSKMAEDFAQRATQLPDGEPWRKEQARQVVMLTRSLSDWLTDPYQGLATVAIRAMRAAMMVCQKNAQ